MSDTYLRPAHGWTCFHCGETFTTRGGARDHFGMEQSADPACRIKIGEERGLVMALRRAEGLLARYKVAEGDIDRQHYAFLAAHDVARKDAEEAGYAKGLADGRAEIDRLHATRPATEDEIVLLFAERFLLLADVKERLARLGLSIVASGGEGAANGG